MDATDTLVEVLKGEGSRVLATLASSPRRGPLGRSQLAGDGLGPDRRPLPLARVDSGQARLTALFSIQTYEESGTALDLLTTCAAGDSTCASSCTPSPAGSTLIAFVSGGTIQREPGIVAASNTVATGKFLIPVP